MKTYTKSNPYSFLSPMGREIKLWEDNGNYWVSMDGVSYDAEESRYRKYLSSGYGINRKLYPEFTENPFIDFASAKYVPEIDKYTAYVKSDSVEETYCFENAEELIEAMERMGIKVDYNWSERSFTIFFEEV